MKVRTFLAFVLIGTLSTKADTANRYINLGSGGFLLGQPEVQIRVFTPDNPATPTDELVIYGPDEFHNRFILDTGANGCMIAQGIYGSALDDMRANGFVDEVCLYEETGVAGSSLYGVSAVYDMDYAGYNGIPLSLTDVRFMCSAETYIEYDGIIGMPAMMGRVLVLDMTPWLPGELGPLMQTTFSDTVPADQPDDLLYTIPLTMVPFAQTGQQNPGDPLPTWAPLPFLNATVFRGDLSGTGTFLLDTGAQLSMISTPLAVALGLDTNGNGHIDEAEATGLMPIGGVGGTVSVPIVSIEGMRLASAEGVDLVWRSFEVLVIDISPEIQGIFAMDLLHSGWMNRALGDPTQPPGSINRIHLDFRHADDGSASLIAEINDYHHTILEPDAPVPTIGYEGDGVMTTSPVTFTVAWDQDVSGFEQSDLTVIGGEIDSFETIAGTFGYRLTVTPAASGYVELVIPFLCCTNAVGSGNASARNAVYYDPAAPRAALSTAVTSPTTTSPIPFRVHFDALVLDFSKNRILVTNGTVSSFAAEGLGKGLLDPTFTFDVTPLENGPVTVHVPSQIADGFTALSTYVGDTLTIAFTGLTSPPVILIESTETTPTAAASIPLTVTFDAAVDGFTQDDVVLSNATLAGFTQTVANTVYTLVLEPIADGWLTVTIPADAVSGAGGGNAATWFQIESDRTAPESRTGTEAEDAEGVYSGRETTPWGSSPSAVGLPRGTLRQLA